MKALSVFLIILLILVICCAALFVLWFFKMKNSGKCPLCMLKKLKFKKQITLDISQYENYNNGVAKTPPMGWSSWNTFRNNIDQDIIMETAGAMVESGLKDAGYQYVNLDDCWQSSMRDSDGKLQGDLRTFGRGIDSLIHDINSLGLKVGLYSSNGDLTCEDMPASLGNEELDAKTFASWGCEFFKYDFCHSNPISGDCPVIEKIEINKTDGNYDDYVTLNAEDAKLFGRAKIIKMNEFKSKKGVAYLNHGAGSATFVTPVLTAGKYALTFVHQKTYRKKYSYAQVTVNGKMYEIFFPYGKGFSNSGRTQIVVDMRAGENEIKIENPVVTLADSSFIQYQRMGNALKTATKQWAQFTNTAEKPIVFSICEWGVSKPWQWGAKAGNMWRTTHDIEATWHSIMELYNLTVDKYEYSAPGAWNDPDMLEVGNGKLTEDENKAHFSLWCMMASPLMLGNDIRKFVVNKDDPALKIVTNKNLIAIDQDVLGKAAKRIIKNSKYDVLARPLSNGDVAVCVLNKSAKDLNVNVKFNDLLSDGYLSFKTYGNMNIVDLWENESFSADSVSLNLAPHSVKVYRIESLKTV